MFEHKINPSNSHKNEEPNYYEKDSAEQGTVGYSCPRMSSQ